jgi:hypothetical protein
MDFYCGRNIGGTTFSRKQQTAYRVECVERNRRRNFINGVPNTGFKIVEQVLGSIIKATGRHFLSQTQTNICFQRYKHIHNHNQINRIDNGALRCSVGQG